MITGPVTRNDRVARESLPAVARDDETLRQTALRQVERIRSFKLHVAIFLVGAPVLSGIWVLTEYLEEHTWPSRFADANDGPGTWSPWLFWAVGVWLLVLAIHAVRTYARRPPTEAEVQREIERLRTRA